MMTRSVSVLGLVPVVMGHALAVVLWGLSGSLQAEVRLPAVLSDGVILQRGQPIPVWGFASAGEQVEVQLSGFAKSTQADDQGRWRVEFPAFAAGGPYVIEVNGVNSISVQDVWFGDVWLCSGQSNMEIPFERLKRRYRQEIAESGRYPVREFRVPLAYDFEAEQEDLVGGKWVVSDPGNLLGMSAVAWFFARNLYETNGVPVGIVRSALGGSLVQSWMSEAALEAFPGDLAEGRRMRVEGVIDAIEQNNRRIEADWYGSLEREDLGLNARIPWYDPQYEIPESCRELSVPGWWDEQGIAMHGALWYFRDVDLGEVEDREQHEIHLGVLVDADTVWVNGVRIGNTGYQYPPRRYRVPSEVVRPGVNRVVIRMVATGGRGGAWPDKPYAWLCGDRELADLSGNWQVQVGVEVPPIAPTVFVRWKPMGLFNGMIAPLTDFPVSGVLWYQGESNTGQASSYGAMLETMIGDWRSRWGDDALPFVVVQLPGFGEVAGEPSESAWAELREQQARVAELPGVHLVVTLDLGEWNDIHPERKREVGERAAKAVRRFVLGEEISGTGPRALEVNEGKDSLLVRFENDPLGGAMVSMDGAPLRWFEVRDEAGRWHYALAEIAEDSVHLRVPEALVVTGVRYAWADNPEGANLGNEAGLLASPFRFEWRQFPSL